MRGFGKFMFRATQSQPVQTVFGCAMTISGVNFQELLSRLVNDPPWYLTSHITQISVIFLGVLVLSYVVWHQAESERGNRERPNVTAVEAFKTMLSHSHRGAELVLRRQEFLNIPLQYEKFLTSQGIIEERLKRRLRDELHDSLRQGRIVAWATPSDGSPEKPISPEEWSNMFMEFSDDEIYGIPWPFGGERQISAWQRKNDPREKIHCYLNVRFARANVYREFPLRVWPRRDDYVQIIKDQEYVIRQEEDAIFKSATIDG